MEPGERAGQMIALWVLGIVIGSAILAVLCGAWINAGNGINPDAPE